MELTELQKDIQRVHAHIADTQRYFTANPSNQAIALEIKSLNRFKSQLESQWEDAIGRLGYSICKYHILPHSHERPSLSAVSAILTAFQKSFTAVYSGMTTSSRRGRIKPEIRERTEFQFGYADPGSLIVNLVINDRQLSFWNENSVFEDTLATMRSMANVHGPSGMKSYAESVGRHAVHCVYNWADTHVAHRSEARMQWRDSKVGSEKDYIVQIPEFANIKQVAEHEVEVSSEVLVLTGRLVIWDVHNRKFRLQVSGFRYGFVAGKISETFDIESRVIVPVFCKANIAQVTQLSPATGKTRIVFVLNHLEYIS